MLLLCVLALACKSKHAVDLPPPESSSREPRTVGALPARALLVSARLCHLRHMDHPSKRGSELMTAEEAGFVPDSPVKTPPAKRQRTSTEAQSATASAQ